MDLVLVLISVLGGLGLWLFNSNPVPGFGIWELGLKSLGQGAGIAGICLLSCNFILAARWKWLEKLSGGLPKMYFNHHWLGVGALVLLLLHPALLSGQYFRYITSILTILIAEYARWEIVLGIGSLAVMVILLVITLFFKWEYQRWKLSHKLLGVSLVLAGLHVTLVPGNLSTNLPLRIYLLFWVMLGIMAWVGKLRTEKGTRRKYLYKIRTIKRYSGDIAEIYMVPVNSKMVYFPGQFVFADFETLGLKGETHPFSLASNPENNEVILGVKKLGDFSEKLMNIKTGTKIWLEGPYGRFSNKYIKGKKQIWIGGGIGITPFLGMVRSLKENDLKSLDIFYSGKNNTQTVFEKEMNKIVLNLGYVKLHIWWSEQKGKLTAEAVAAKVSDYKNRQIMICGPKMMIKSLKKQFLNLGVSAKNIYTEEFVLYGD